MNTLRKVLYSNGKSVNGMESPYYEMTHDFEEENRLFQSGYIKGYHDAMMKGTQEAKQVIRKQCKKEHDDGSIDYFAEWYCPHCNSLLKRGFDAAWIEYCFKCGKPITWERSVK